MKHQNETERAQLQEAWLRFSGDIVTTPQDWLNKSFSFIESHYAKIGLERSLELCSQSKFEEISSSLGDLIDYIIEYCAYTINARNLRVIVMYLTKESVEVGEFKFIVGCLKTKQLRLYSIC